MAYRLTNTDKWNDQWFSGLDWRQKVVFLYLCDQCDMAGFYEINLRKMAWDIAIDCADVEGALKGLKSRLLYSSDGKYLFLRNFIKHQKNLPLNEKNKFHSGIIKRLNENLKSFNFQSIDEYFARGLQAPCKPLASPISNNTITISSLDINNTNTDSNSIVEIKGLVMGLNDCDKVNKGASKGLARGFKFLPPSLEDVTAYCQERGNTINPQQFIDHYEARGWEFKTGQKMKDWKAAVRTWERNNFESKSVGKSSAGGELKQKIFNQLKTNNNGK